MIIPSWLQNLVPPLPPGPAPPPSTGGQTGGSGTPDDPAVILVIGQRPPPGPPVGYGPYGGMTGAEARAARDMAWAMGTPEDRVRAMGLDPYASITADDGSGLYRLVDDLELQGTNDYLQWAAEEFSNSIDNYQVGRAGEALAREKISQLGYTIEGEQVRVKVRMEDGTWKLRVYDFLGRVDKMPDPQPDRPDQGEAEVAC